MSRRRALLVVLAASVAGVVLAPAAPAQAHPLGNFSINQYHGFVVRPGAVDVTVAVDRAEIPTRQRPSVACGEVAAALSASVDDVRLQWTVTAERLAIVPGVAGLPTSRLDCTLHGRFDGAGAVLKISNGYATGHVGWREMTAVGDGVRLVDSPLPARSASDELRGYPSDPLASPLDMRAATVRFEPGAGGAGGDAGPGRDEASPASGVIVRWAAAAERRLTDLAGSGRLTPGVGVLAVLLALLLGAGHAALPGHGKTALAAYAAARGGRRRDALTLGATVTLSHTGGVLAVGALISASAAFAGERVLAWLGAASGALVLAVGVAMLVSAHMGRRPHEHGHAHGGHGHHDHDHDHDHDHRHDHRHDRPGGRLGLAGIGLAGGLVPSPSALVVLLGAVALGRTAFGVLLVVAYGAGMAATLTAAGFVAVAVRRWAARRAGSWRFRRPRRLPSSATATASLVMLVGAGLALRAVSTLS